MVIFKHGGGQKSFARELIPSSPTFKMMVPPWDVVQRTSPDPVSNSVRVAVDEVKPTAA